MTRGRDWGERLASERMTEERTTADSRRSIPAVGKLLQRPELARLLSLYGRTLVRVQVQRELEELRSARLDSEKELVVASIVARVGRSLELAVGTPLRRVINATGIFLHTNLGRAPLPVEVAEAFPPLLTAACDLELDLEANRRDDRNWRAERLLCHLTGAESALVVNNNAAALVLALAALARDREVLVSRGELVEIGGSFRIPDILQAAGVRLVEVGTTNRTRISDYERALGPQSAMLLKVYPSNYRIRGFTESVGAEELAALGRRGDVPVVVDEGSGLLAPHPAPQLREHRSLRELMSAGCDLACGSGDKLLGGPQAGLMVGTAAVVRRCRRHPLYRAFRPSRATFIALEPVLRMHLAGGALPIDRLWPEPELHRQRLERVAERLGAGIVEADAYVGGGAAPEAPIPGEAIALPDRRGLLRRLRLGAPPVVGYLKEGVPRLDLRTVAPVDDDALIAAVGRAMADTPMGEEPVGEERVREGT